MKDKKCNVCKELFTPRQFAQSVCNYTCSIIHVKKLKEQKDAKEWRVRKADLKEQLKTLSKYEAEAKQSFQKYVRLRDAKLPCISCGNANPKDWCGSHYFSAGMYSGLMFDERNCHGACNTYCNKMLSGNLLEYRKGLIKRYGIEYVDKLESESDAKRNYKYTKYELVAKKLKYDILAKELNK